MKVLKVGCLTIFSGDYTLPFNIDDARTQTAYLHARHYHIKYNYSSLPVVQS